MSDRHVAVIAAITLFTGCALQPSPDPMPPPVQEVCETSHVTQEQEPESSSEEAFSSLDRMMVYRQQVCKLDEAERVGMWRLYRADDGDEAVMARLMLASCDPQSPPGMFSRSLTAARQQHDAPPGFFAFLELLETQQRAYTTLESQLKNTEQQLEEMIEGIRTIEAEMGVETPNGQNGTPDE